MDSKNEFDFMNGLDVIVDGEIEISVKYLNCLMEARKKYREGKYTDDEYSDIIYSLISIHYQTPRRLLRIDADKP